MSLLTNVIRFFGRKRINAVDVETAFAEVVKILGGTYYVNGASTPQTNGTLDATNFKPASIPNELKLEPYSYFPIRVFQAMNTFTAGTAITRTVTVPFDCIGQELTAGFGGGDGTINVGTAVVSVNNLQLVSHSLNALVARTALTPAAGALASYKFKAGDVIKTVVTVTSFTAGTTAIGPEVTIWVKAKHVQ